MSRRSDLDYIEDMLEAARRAVSYCSGKSYEDFLQDMKTQDAVARNIEILGEAVKSLSDAACLDNPGVPWRSIAGMRDRLIHHYFGVNWDVVWEVVTGDLPVLIEKLETIVHDRPNNAR